jgi:hypothetical protein
MKLNTHAISLALWLRCISTYSAEPIADHANSDYGSKRIQCSLTVKQLLSAPKWNNERDTIPLSSKAASESAVRMVFETFGHNLAWPNADGWEASEVTLIMSPVADDVWYYRISVSRKTPGTGTRPLVAVFVPLDGKAAKLVVAN